MVNQRCWKYMEIHGRCCRTKLRMNQKNIIFSLTMERFDDHVVEISIENQKEVPPPEVPNMTIAGKSTMNESMYFLLKMGDFPAIVMLGTSGGVTSLVKL